MVHENFLRKQRLVQRFLQVLLPLLQEERPKLQPLLKALSNDRQTELLVKVLEVLGEDGRMGSCAKIGTPIGRRKQPMVHLAVLAWLIIASLPFW